MLSIFDNETELGKLYINYPMVEAYYDLESLPDPNYNDKTVSLKGLNGKTYKKKVNMTTCLKKNKITKKDLCYIIMHNYNKAKLITNTSAEYLNYFDILDSQLKLKQKENKIYALSTFPLMLIDYNLEKTMEILKIKLKNKFIEFNE